MLRIKNKTEYELLYQQSVSDPIRFWDAVASSFVWRKKWDTVIEGDFSSADIRWFQGAKFNITENCLDRHLEVNGNKLAFIWEPNHPNEVGRRFTYIELFNEVCKCANMLRNNGVKKGDRVCIYLPMVPEAVISMLACARIGAIHSVVFGGFSAASLAGRMQDCDNVVLITSDGAYRGDKEISLKKVADEALELCPSVKKVIVLQRTGAMVHMEGGRDQWWHDAMNGMSIQCEAEEMDAEDILFILYTSGSTGKPKGVVHTCGGYMVYTQYSFENVFQYQPDDLFWCTADVGWITGHSYITYGPLLAGASQVIFEGVPTYPDAGRFWKIIDKYNVSIFYTAPTAIRALEAAGTSFVEPYSLKSLRILGSVGEPINVEAWNWYNIYIGKSRCPIVDTWWQTETGGILISPLAGITETKPGFATLPLPGVQPVLVDEKGQEIEGNDVEGNLCIRFPWPSIIRTTYGDHERCRQTYFSTYHGLYFTGDGCKRDKDGFYRITGRVDDVINVSGHRIGTAEVESAINLHPDIVESAVVGFPHEIKGQGIYAYVISTKSHDDLALLRKEIIAIVNKQIGPIAKPDKIQVVPGLPKTRSGKIMRRILRKIAEGDVSNLGDISTLLDQQVVEQIKNEAL
ncbi:MAG: acetate--CoA ligase [Flavobacteriales bacterium]